MAIVFAHEMKISGHQVDDYLFLFNSLRLGFDKNWRKVVWSQYYCLFCLFVSHDFLCIVENTAKDYE
jgi:hypothetical protein